MMPEGYLVLSVHVLAGGLCGESDLFPWRQQLTDDGSNSYRVHLYAFASPNIRAIVLRIATLDRDMN